MADGYRMRFDKKKAMAAVTKAGAKAINRTLEVTVELAKDRSPKKLGHNAGTITHDSVPEDLSKKGRVYTQSGYGGWLELGTSKMAARPYMHPSFDQAVDMTAERYLKDSV